MKPPKDCNSFETDILTLWFKDGVLYASAKKTTRTIDNLRVALSVMKELVKGRKVCLLTETNDILPYDPSVPKDLLHRELSQIFKAIAILCCSPVGKMVTNIQLMRHKPCPIRYFNRQEEALAWLKEFK